MKSLCEFAVFILGVASLVMTPLGMFVLFIGLAGRFIDDGYASNVQASFIVFIVCEMPVIALAIVTRILRRSYSPDEPR